MRTKDTAFQTYVLRLRFMLKLNIPETQLIL